MSGLTRLKKNFIISPLSNGNVALLVNMAKHAGLPWDLVLSAEVFKHYKPDPETYLGAAKILSLRPEQVMLVAAHNNDLAAARGCWPQDRLRAPADRVWAFAEPRFWPRGRVGFRREGFQRSG